MIKKVHIIGLGLMGTNLGIKLVEKGVRVSGTDILEKNVIRAKDYGALNNEFDPEENKTSQVDEEFNQETDEELLDIPTFLRRQAN